MLLAIHCPGGKVVVGPGVVVVVGVGVVGSGQATNRSKGPKQLNNSMIFEGIFGEKHNHLNAVTWMLNVIYTTAEMSIQND